MNNLDTQKRYFSRIDTNLIFLYVFLVLFGWANIMATEYFSSDAILNFTYNNGKQFLWILLSFFVAFIILLLDARFFTSLAYLIYFSIILVLIGVLLLGKEVAGSKSWLVIHGDIRLQPSEFAKLGVALALSKFLGGQFRSIKKTKDFLIAVAIIIFPLLLVLLQKDTGTALVFFAFFLVFFREGWSFAYLILGIWFAIIFVLSLVVNIYILLSIVAVLYFVLTWFARKNRGLVFLLLGVFVLSSGMILSINPIFNKVLREHQKDRILILLGERVDPKGVGYNINQSLIAIGSGGFFGKGYLNGTQTKLNFVPEQSTDFIFCTIAEEWGFVGSTVVIALFVLLMSRIILLAEKQKSTFSRIYGYCLASVLFFHFTINIGMTLNLLPIIGIPLPFFSYGGSSLLAFTIMLFIFIKLNTRKNDLL